MLFSLNQNFTDTDPVRNGKTAVTHEERNIKKEEKVRVSQWECVFVSMYICVGLLVCCRLRLCAKSFLLDPN